MKKILILIAMYLLSFNANAQETPSIANTTEQNKIPDNTRTIIYLHPATLIAGIEFNSFIMYLTIEKPNNLSTSLIIRPSLWNVGVGESSFFNDNKTFRIGSDIGLRYYLNEKGHDWHIQGQIGLFYYSHSYTEWIYDGYSREVTKDENSLWFDIMGYVGQTYKFKHMSIYTNAGIGYASTPFNNGMNLMYDFNLGIGFPLGKTKQNK